MGAASNSKTAFVFPGQGSQKVGMGRALRDAYPESRAVFDEVDEALGYGLSKLCFEGPDTELTLTANAQPAILATSALYSPSEWPATATGRTGDRASRARSAATLVARIAGCAFAVSVSSASGPSKHSFDSEYPSASSASPKTARASGY